MNKFFRKPTRPPFRIFFATDVHGSDRCFRKFLAAASGYQADALILGGDVAGKAMVPIVPEGKSQFAYSFQGVRATIAASDLEDVKQRMNFNGFYPRVTEASEVQRMTEDPQYVVTLFEEVITDQIAGWCDLCVASSLPATMTPG
jgi:hypothetical protein